MAITLRRSPWGRLGAASIILIVGPSSVQASIRNGSQSMASKSQCQAKEVFMITPSWRRFILGGLSPMTFKKMTFKKQTCEKQACEKQTCEKMVFEKQAA